MPTEQSVAGAAAMPPAPPQRSRFKLALRIAGVVLGVAGYWISADLLRITGGGAPSNPLLAAACGPAAEEGGGGDCLSVLRSEFAYVNPDASGSGEGESTRGRLPWAALGAAYFAFVALWYLLVGPPSRSRWWWHLPIAVVVLFGLFASGGLMWVMGYQLKRWCVGCLAAHAANLGLGVVTIVAFPWRRPAAPAPPPYPTLAHGAAALLACYAFFRLNMVLTVQAISTRTFNEVYRNYKGLIEEPNFILWKHAQQLPAALPAEALRDAFGPADAPHSVVAFVDFQCPQCQKAHDLIDSLSRRYPDRLRVAFRHFPLDARCNSSNKTTPHPAACAAAAALEAARALGGSGSAEAMRFMLHTRRTELDRGDFDAWAGEIQLDPVRFSEARRAAAALDAVKADVALGLAAGVSSVPTIFLDGRRVEFWQSEKAWEALLGVPASQPAKK